MRNIFIDCGYHKGNVTEMFKRKESESFEYFAFEANPHLFKRFCERHSFCKLENKAVWIEDSKVTFYIIEIDKNPKKENFMAGASTLNKKKAEWNERVHKKQGEITVDSLDFSNFILKNFSKEDNIVVKMDIEGAEYEVLEKMIKDDSIDYLDELIVEFHDDRTGMDSKIIKEKLKERSLKVKEWE